MWCCHAGGTLTATALILVTLGCASKEPLRRRRLGRSAPRRAYLVSRSLRYFGPATSQSEVSGMLDCLKSARA